MNDKHLKIYFLLILKNYINFTIKKEYVTFILLYLWVKYESMWPDFNIKTVICSAMLIKTKTLTQKSLFG